MTTEEITEAVIYDSEGRPFTYKNLRKLTRVEHARAARRAGATVWTKALNVLVAVCWLVAEPTALAPLLAPTESWSTAIALLTTLLGATLIFGYLYPPVTALWRTLVWMLAAIIVVGDLLVVVSAYDWALPTSLAIATLIAATRIGGNGRAVWKMIQDWRFTRV